MLLSSERRYYYFKNLSILNISNNDYTLFWDVRSSEHEKLWRYSNHKSPNSKDCSEFGSADPPISFYYQILRIGGPVLITIAADNCSWNKHVCFISSKLKKIVTITSERKLGVLIAIGASAEGGGGKVAIFFYLF